MTKTMKSRLDGFCVSPRKSSEIQLVAKTIRELFVPPDIKYFDVMRFLENQMPSLCDAFHCEVVEDHDLPNREAEYDPEDVCVRLRESVYIAAHNNDGHCRFTVAHELGHHFLHRDQPLAFGHSAANEAIPIYRNSEWQADIFARNLLAPASMASGMSVAAVAEIFGVSLCVAQIIKGYSQKAKPYKLPPIVTPESGFLTGLNWNTVK